MKCIRCGRSIESDELFCVECEAILEAESLAANEAPPALPPQRGTAAATKEAPPKGKKKRPALSDGKRTEGKAAASAKAPAKEAGKLPKDAVLWQKSRKTKRRLTVALCCVGVLLCLSVAALIYGYRTYYRNILVEKNQLRRREDTLAAQEEANRKTAAELTQTQQALTAANETISQQELAAKTLQAQLDEQEKQAKQQELALEQQKKDYDALLQEKEQLSEELAAASEQQNAMQSENQSLSGRIIALLSEIAGLQSKNSGLQTTTEFFKSSVCFVGYNDRYYHCYGCSKLNLSGTWKVYRIYAAQAAGYTACATCGG